MDISEGTIVKLDLCPLSDMILKRDSISPSIIESAISYVETAPFCQLKRNITTEFVCEMKRFMDHERENRETSGLLKRLILSIAFRGSLSCRFSCHNSFNILFKDCRLLSVLEKENGESILSYSFMMKK
jgi:hypothetical protein